MLRPEYHSIHQDPRPLLFTLIILLLQGVMSPADAQEFDPETEVPLNTLQSKKPDIENGKALADKLCVACHAVDGPSPSGHVDVPSFKAAANREGQTTETLANWLLSPHPPMPNPNLTREEIRDIGGFVLSLRDAK